MAVNLVKNVTERGTFENVSTNCVFRWTVIWYVGVMSII